MYVYCIFILTLKIYTVLYNTIMHQVTLMLLQESTVESNVIYLIYTFIVLSGRHLHYTEDILFLELILNILQRCYRIQYKLSKFIYHNKLPGLTALMLN